MCDSCAKHAAPTSSSKDSQRCRRPLFPVGQVVATRGVMDHLLGRGIDPLPYILRHQCGDWGDIPSEDARANNRALTNGGRIVSAYEIGGGRCWVITEANRSVTTILFPSEY